MTVGLALSKSRRSIDELIAGTEPFSERGQLYRGPYLRAVANTGLETVELIDRFPVLTGNFGYCRGSSEPGASRLNPFTNPRNGNLVIYADIAETEALFLRLDPEMVWQWLKLRHPELPDAQGNHECRIRIIEWCAIPGPADSTPTPTPGGSLLELLHAYSHRFIRRASVFSGIDRNALSELLVPLHLGVFVYAGSRGDFVSGGLQAVFETDLNSLLRDFTESEFRCPLDPGCRKSGGACMACLHLGEPVVSILQPAPE